MKKIRNQKKERSSGGKPVVIRSGLKKTSRARTLSNIAISKPTLASIIAMAIVYKH